MTLGTHNDEVRVLLFGHLNQGIDDIIVDKFGPVVDSRRQERDAPPLEVAA
jgi:hypothetical protein